MSAAQVSTFRLNFDFRAVIPFVTRIVTGGLSYGIFALTARITEAATFSLFAFIFSLIHIVGPLAALGQATVVMKHLPLVNGSDLPLVAGRIFAGFRYVGLGVCLGGAVAGVLLLTRLQEPLVLVLVLAVIAVFAVNDYLAASRRALGSIAGPLISRDLVWRAGMFSALLIIWLEHGHVSLVQLMAILLLGFVIAAKTLVYPLVPVFRAMSRRKTVAAIPKSEWMLFVGLTATELWFAHGDVILLTLCNIDAGSYFVAHRTSTLLHMVTASMTFIAMPRISQAFHEGDFQALENMSRYVARASGAIVIALALVTIVAAPWIMRVFGERFIEDAYLLQILCLAPALNALGGLYATIPVLCGYQRGFFLTLLSVIVVGSIIRVWLASMGALGWFAAVPLFEIVCTFAAVAWMIHKHVRLKGPF